MKENADRILDICLKEVDTIPEIYDKAYAMGLAVGFKLGKLVEGNQGDRKKKCRNGGNRREQKLKKEIKELHQKETTEKSNQEGKGEKHRVWNSARDSYSPVGFCISEIPVC